MINRLRWKFIGIATLAVLIVLTATLGLVNQFFMSNAIRQDRTILNKLVKSQGRASSDYHTEEIDNDYLGISGELRYQMRYFTVWLSEDRERVLESNFAHIHSVTREEAEIYSKKIMGKRKDSGILKAENGYFLYKRVRQDDGRFMIVVLDCTREINSALALRSMSIGFGLACLIFFFVLVTAMSGKAVEPVIRNMESQKQFITNASHELKTPIAIISANTEVLEMMEGENEWTSSTMNQVQRLSGLVNNLITLSRMGEGNKEDYLPVNYSDCLKKVAEAFSPLISREGKAFSREIEEDIFVQGRRSELEEIANILLDNAVKYCDDGGEIHLSLSLSKPAFPMGRTASLAVSNSYKEGGEVDCSRFFERFYREDSSHNSEKAGYGIGLAMAQGFTEEHRGRISASWKDGIITFLVKLPASRTISGDRES